MNSRTKGHGFERWCASKLREIWPNVQTCRFGGNLWLDSCGVDLINTPGFNVQCKAVEKLSPSHHEILSRMPQGQNINIIIHKKNNKGIIVAMKFEDFLTLIQAVPVRQVPGSCWAVPWEAHTPGAAFYKTIER